MVTGLTTPAGLGLYVERRNIGEGGRHRWGLTHRKSGILIVHIHGTPEEAVALAQLIVNLADYTAYDSLSDLIAADPLWHPHLLGVKHSLAPCWMEFDDPDANDPRNMIPLNDPPAIFRLARHAAEPAH
jgi:hypothetical protein